MKCLTRAALAALLALALAGCQTTGAEPAATPPAEAFFGKGRENTDALIGGALLGKPSLAPPAPAAREQSLMERWKRDRQFF
ncbi:hypothetical protein [Azospirillum sp. SYSU D00513]|uniref:hypothetical protein n=1 Tax=Azospirillum sp. SYSU D00513 TaxID=2812561 RepID=UPI001A959969|nr:hypothetical protein [Azospirillum sp. SYSU D00513]